MTSMSLFLQKAGNMTKQLRRTLMVRPWKEPVGGRS